MSERLNTYYLLPVWSVFKAHSKPFCCRFRSITTVLLLFVLLTVFAGKSKKKKNNNKVIIIFYRGEDGHGQQAQQENSVGRQRSVPCVDESTTGQETERQTDGKERRTGQ